MFRFPTVVVYWWTICSTVSWKQGIIIMGLGVKMRTGYPVMMVMVIIALITEMQAMVVAGMVVLNMVCVACMISASK